MHILSSAPTGLTCQLLTHPEKAKSQAHNPVFGWIVNSDIQSAYHIQTASSPTLLTQNAPDLWDLKEDKASSINVKYTGKPLSSNSEYCWRVKIWGEENVESDWSEIQHFYTGELTENYTTSYYPLEKTELAPEEFIEKDKGHYFIDFGKDAFGTIKFTIDSPIDKQKIEIHLSEAATGDNMVDRNPEGCIRYSKLELSLKKGTHEYTVEIPPDERNTGPAAILLPEEIGDVTPFRYCELVNLPSPVDKSMVKQVIVHYHFDDNASHFESSDSTLNAVWELCKYSIKATSSFGIYIDGDRERIPYEADAYINQLCHYCVDQEYSMARRSHEYLLFNPTWPTEWILFSVLIAWEDYLYTGNKDSLAEYYAELKAKTLSVLSNERGFISTQTGLMTDEVLKSIHINTPLRDIVDWPPASFTDGGKGERDGHEMLEVNTIVNAFYYRALYLMSKIATVLSCDEDAANYADLAQKTHDTINSILFDNERHIYVDGEGSTHTSLHANMFPLAFGLVPEQHIQSVADFIESRGMACSVYGAQFLLEALYIAGKDDYALKLMTNQDDRSWVNMINCGSTITLEAWDMKYKNNLDWNHAWGAAPANIIPRYLMGVRPLEPGFSKILIKPQPGSLSSASAVIPTIRGPVKIDFTRNNKTINLHIEIPGNTTATLDLSHVANETATVNLDNKAISGAKLTILPGNHSVEII